jgi:hypothetical protein
MVNVLGTLSYKTELVYLLIKQLQFKSVKTGKTGRAAVVECI